MTLRERIVEKVDFIINSPFEVADVSFVPDITNPKLTFGNTGLRFNATVLYIDMRGSTAILNRHNKDTIAKIHMAYFHTIVNIAKALGGEIRSFNGDSMLVFFLGTAQEPVSNAVKVAMQMKYMIADPHSGINTILSKYSAIDFGIGIDCGTIVCTKVGVGGTGDNKDLMWVGNAVNRATVISDDCQEPYHIGISKAAFQKLPEDLLSYNQQNYWGRVQTVYAWQLGNIEYNKQRESCYFTSCHYAFT